MQKRRTLCLIVALLLLALTAAASALSVSLGSRSRILSESGIKTGQQNNTVAFDDARNLVFMGAYTNQVTAFREVDPVWTFQTNGSVVRLIARPELGRLWIGCVDNHVYMIDIETGALLGDINVQRRIYDIDVTRDGALVLVSAGVNTAKHNLMLYTAEGEQRYNQQFRTQIKGCAFTADGTGFVAVNSRGELQRFDLEGNVLATAKVSYEQIALEPFSAAQGAAHLSLGSDGAYTVFDDDTNILLTGRPALEAGDVPTSVGSSADGSLIFVGTKDRYLYAMDLSGRQVYSARLSNTPSCMAPRGDAVYVTGLGDFLYTLDASALAGNALLGDTAALLRRAAPVFAALCAFFLLLFIPASNRLLGRAAKALVKHRAAYLLLIPTFVLLFMFNYLPTGMAFVRAFTDWSKTNFQRAQISFVGLNNFRMMFTEDYFLRGMKNLAVIIGTSFVKVLTVPLILAWMVSMMGSDRKKYIYRFLLVLPIVVPGVVSALLWQQIYDPQIGLLNQLLKKLGLEAWQRVWLGNEKTALWAIIFMGFPFVNAMAFLVYYGGFTSIDVSIFESAYIDGASRGRIFRSIQLPLVGPQVKLMLTLTFIGGVQDFYPIYLLTGGGPGTSTYVPSLEIYLNATTFGRYGYACALGILMFLFIMIGTLVNMKLQKADAGVGKRGAGR